MFRHSRWAAYATALLVIAAAFAFTPAKRWVPSPSYAIALQIDSSAPDGAQLVVNVKGDSTEYVAEGVLRHVCIPVVPDSAGITARLVVGVNGQPILSTFIVFFPNPSLPQVNVIADSGGVHVRRSTVLTCHV